MPIETDNLARKIAIAKAVDLNREDSWKNKYGPYDSMPEGYFKKDELGRFLVVEGYLLKSFEEVMQERGIENFRTRKEFDRGGRNVEFILEFRDGEKEEEWDKKKPFKKVSLNYSLGRWTRKLILITGLIEVVLPKKYENQFRVFKLREIELLINSADARELVFKDIGLDNTKGNEINLENISDLLRLCLVSPETVLND